MTDDLRTRAVNQPRGEGNRWIFATDNACGTRAGYVRHLRRKETPCDPCRDADAAYKREWGERKRELVATDPEQVPHGTTGYRYGCRCDVCSAAQAVEAAANYRRRRADELGRSG